MCTHTQFALHRYQWLFLVLDASLELPSKARAISA